MASSSAMESVDVSDSSASNAGTIKKQIMAAWGVEMRMKTRSIVCPLSANIHQPPPHNRLPFYCVHSITGAGGAELVQLATLLTAAQPLLAIQAPISMRRKEIAQSLESLVTNYCKKLLSVHEAHYGKEQFIIGGFSAGAVIALEMAQRLTGIGRPPALLVAIDKAPRNTKAEIDPLQNTLFRNLYLWLRLKWRKSSSASEFINNLFRKISWSWRHQRLFGGDLSELENAVRMKKLTENARTKQEKEFIETLYEELEGYVPRAYEGKVLVLMTREGCVDRVAAGWKAIAKHPKILRVSGTHTSIIRGTVTNGIVDLADVRGLAEVLRRELALDQIHQQKLHLPRIWARVAAPLRGALHGWRRIVGPRPSGLVDTEMTITAVNTGASRP